MVIDVYITFFPYTDVVLCVAVRRSVRLHLDRE